MDMYMELGRWEDVLAVAELTVSLRGHTLGICVFYMCINLTQRIYDFKKLTKVLICEN